MADGTHGIGKASMLDLGLGCLELKDHKYLHNSPLLGAGNKSDVDVMAPSPLSTQTACSSWGQVLFTFRVYSFAMHNKFSS